MKIPVPLIFAIMGPFGQMLFSAYCNCHTLHPLNCAGREELFQLHLWGLYLHSSGTLGPLLGLILFRIYPLFSSEPRRNISCHYAICVAISACLPNKA